MKNRNIIPFAGIATCALLAIPALADRDTPPQERAPATPGQSSDRARTTPDVVKGRLTEPEWSQLRSSSDFIGQDIKQADEDKTIGSISDAYIDFGSGKVLGVVVGTGGFLGIGERQSLISLDALQPIADSKDFKSDMTQDQVEAAPEIENDKAPDFTTLRKHRSRDADRAVTGQAADAQPHAGEVVLLSDLTSMDIVNRDDEKIGSLDSVYLDLVDHQVIGVVVSTGGFLGIGDHKTLLSFRELHYDGTEDALRVHLTKVDLEEAPEYRSGEADLGDRMRDRWEAFRSGMDREASVLEQGMGRADIKTTAAIRRELREQDELSRRARYVTIITKDGHVTVRGEVASNDEKEAVERIVKSNAGGNELKSELTVKQD